MTVQGSERVTVFIDGFNLYHGLRDAHAGRFLWLDLEAASRRLLKPHQTLTWVRYFTAPVRDDVPALTRQNAYLGALRCSPSVRVELGRFQEKHQICRHCGRRWRTYEEKETDVGIAVALLEDGFTNQFDTAIVISADSDLCPAVRALRRLRPGVRVIAVFPPKRRSDGLRRMVTASFTLSSSIIRQSQLPPVVSDSSGVEYHRPPGWR